MWISDCLRRRPHPTHAHLDAVLGWARDLKVGQLLLTHLDNSMDYATLGARIARLGSAGVRRAGDRARMTNDMMLGGLYLADGADAGARRADQPRASRSPSCSSWRWPGWRSSAAASSCSPSATISAASRQRLRAEATGDAGRRSARRSASRWRSTAISGSMARSTAQPVKFLVDSGATMTTIDRGTRDARRRGDRSDVAYQMVRTGNGMIQVAARPCRQRCRSATIERRASGCTSPTATRSTCSA